MLDESTFSEDNLESVLDNFRIYEELRMMKKAAASKRVKPHPNF